MNAIYNMVHNTLKNLSLGGYIVDCPQIERLGYGGDGNASAMTAQTFFNLAPLYMNWMQAWNDCQREDGGMPHTAPNPYTAGGGPYWCGFIIPASWLTYVNYGDMRLMERYYPVMQKWLGYAESYQVDGLLKQWPNTEYRGWYLGDWVPPMGINPQDPQSIDIVNNCFLSECYHMMTKIAKALGKEADIPGYQQKHEALNSLIHETFFDEEQHNYASASQIDLIYPMLVGATPDGLVSSVRATLMQESAGRFKGHIATGLVGVNILTQWATKNQETDYVYQMLKKRTYPGYLYMIDNGATLTWEEWDGERSQLHNCYNAIGSWFIQALAGITPDEANPGYKHFFIRPQLVEGISWAKASKDTPYGVCEVSWKQGNGSFEMDVEIPVGSSATAILPNGEEMKLASGIHRVSCKM
jgi:alpha-L-rhamnosidase